MTDITKRILIGAAAFIVITATLYLVTHWVLAPFESLSASDEATIRGWSVWIGALAGIFTGGTAEL